MDSGPRLARLAPDSPHVATLAGWARVEWGHLNPGREAASAVAAFREHCGPAGVPSVFAALAGERPVGMASLVVDDMPDRPELTPWLASVYVLPEWRGRGLAAGWRPRPGPTASSAFTSIRRTARRSIGGWAGRIASRGTIAARR